MVINTDEFSAAVIDVETDILNEDGRGFKASPFHEPNKIVMLGIIMDGDVNGVVFDMVYPRHDDDFIPEMIFKHNMLIGHNIKFDLLYLRKTFPKHYEEWAKHGTVWDTMVVEYLLSGQDNKMPSLNYCAGKYGGTQKEDKIKEYWEEGINTRDIPQDELDSYLREDIKNTKLVFEEQWEQVEDKGMLPLVTTQMEALLALAEMEWNGFLVDVVALANEAHRKQVDLNEREAKLEEYIAAVLPKERTFKKITPRSPAQLSLLYFGGECDVVYDEPMLDGNGSPILFKSGKRKGEVRTKKRKDTVTLGEMVSPTKPKGKSGYYPVDDEVLQWIVKYPFGTTTELVNFTHDLLEFRALDKDLNTYYLGYLRECWPDSCVHPNFNQALTATGRLSCSKPNLQNMSKKEF